MSSGGIRAPRLIADTVVLLRGYQSLETTSSSISLTPNRTLIADSSGIIAVSTITSSELGMLAGMTANIADTFGNTQEIITGAATTITGQNLTAGRVAVSTSAGKMAISDLNSSKLMYLDDVTSAIQAQIDTKQPNVTSSVSLTTGSMFVNNRLTVNGTLTASDLIVPNASINTLNAQQVNTSGLTVGTVTTGTLLATTASITTGNFQQVNASNVTTGGLLATTASITTGNFQQVNASDLSVGGLLATTASITTGNFQQVNASNVNAGGLVAQNASLGVLWSGSARINNQLDVNGLLATTTMTVSTASAALLNAQRIILSSTMTAETATVRSLTISSDLIHANVFQTHASTQVAMAGNLVINSNTSQSGWAPASGRWLSLFHSTFNGNAGALSPNPECGIVMANRGNGDTMPWLGYMGIVKDTASTSLNSIRMDLGIGWYMDTKTSGANTSMRMLPAMTFRAINNGSTYIGIGQTVPSKLFHIAVPTQFDASFLINGRLDASDVVTGGLLATTASITTGNFQQVNSSNISIGGLMAITGSITTLNSNQVNTSNISTGGLMAITGSITTLNSNQVNTSAISTGNLLAITGSITTLNSNQVNTSAIVSGLLVAQNASLAILWSGSARINNQLDVNGTATASIFTAGRIAITGSFSFGGRGIFNDAVTFANVTDGETGGTITASAQNLYLNAHRGGGYTVFINNQGAVSGEVMRLGGANGRVGINTADPAVQLHVTGDTRIVGQLNSSALVTGTFVAQNASIATAIFTGSVGFTGVITASNVINAYKQITYYGATDADQGGWITASQQFLQIVGNRGGKGITFCTNFGGVNEVMRLNASGMMGLGTPSPQVLLHVMGSTRIEGQLSASDLLIGNASIALLSTGSTQVNNNLIVNGFYQRQGTGQFYKQYTTSFGTYAGSSDRLWTYTTIDVTQLGTALISPVTVNLKIKAANGNGTAYNDIEGAYTLRNWQTNSVGASLEYQCALTGMVATRIQAGASFHVIGQYGTTATGGLGNLRKIHVYYRPLYGTAGTHNGFMNIGIDGIQSYSVSTESVQYLLDTDFQTFTSSVDWNTSYIYFGVDSRPKIGIGIDQADALLDLQADSSSPAFQIRDQIADTTIFKIDCNGDVGIGVGAGNLAPLLDGVDIRKSTVRISGLAGTDHYGIYATSSGIVTRMDATAGASAMVISGSMKVNNRLDVFGPTMLLLSSQPSFQIISSDPASAFPWTTQFIMKERGSSNQYYEYRTSSGSAGQGLLQLFTGTNTTSQHIYTIRPAAAQMCWGVNGNGGGTLTINHDASVHGTTGNGLLLTTSNISAGVSLFNIARTSSEVGVTGSEHLMMTYTANIGGGQKYWYTAISGPSNSGGLDAGTSHSLWYRFSDDLRPALHLAPGGKVMANSLYVTNGAGTVTEITNAVANTSVAMKMWVTKSTTTTSGQVIVNLPTGYFSNASYHVNLTTIGGTNTVAQVVSYNGSRVAVRCFNDNGTGLTDQEFFMTVYGF